MAETQSTTTRRSCCFPAICVLPDGRWLCGFRGAPTKIGMQGQNAWLTFSADKGLSWSTPVAPFDPPRVNGRPGLFRGVYCTALGGHEILATLLWVDHSNPDAPFFNEATQGLLDCKIFLARSCDEGRTWSTPRLMDTAPFTVLTPLTGPILLLKKGGRACQFELNKPYGELNEWRHASVLLFSHDQGASWPEYSLASSDPANRVFYWDQRLGVTPEDTLLDFFWTYDNAAAQYLNIHARRSRDGRNWSPMWDTGIAGQPARPVFLPDDRIALIYVEREVAPLLKLRLSSDGARTFPASTEQVLFELPGTAQTVAKSSMQAAWSEMAAFSLGLPDTALLPDGDILVIFYAGPHADQTDIRWIRVRA